MRTGLVISTYNQPVFLKLVLASVERQSSLPDQLLIADDGSGDETGLLIDEFSSRVPFPVEHCWQEDLGFRKTRILNQSLRKADTDYLVFSDGDMLLHPHYLRDHCDIAKPGQYVQGRRICLNQSATQRHLKTGRTRVSLFQRGINRRPQTIRSRFLMLMSSSRNNSLKNSRGCNQAFWRQDLLDVNGYEELLEGWGREDTELCARLHNLGKRRHYARHWALAYHLYHPELSRDRDEANLRLLRETVERGKIHAVSGLSGNVSENPRAA